MWFNSCSPGWWELTDIQAGLEIVFHPGWQAPVVSTPACTKLRSYLSSGCRISIHATQGSAINITFLLVLLMPPDRSPGENCLKRPSVNSNKKANYILCLFICILKLRDLICIFMKFTVALGNLSFCFIKISHCVITKLPVLVLKKVNYTSTLQDFLFSLP